MYLSPTEEDRLRIFRAAELARRARGDGVRLNVPEATALICDEMHRAARAGGSLDQVAAAGRAAVSQDDLMDGVAPLLAEIRLEVLLGDGMRLVVLRDPLAPDSGSTGLSSTGLSSTGGSHAGAGDEPGRIRRPDREIPLGAGLARRRIRVTSRSARPIRVSSHYPFWRVNPRLEFDRAAATGYRLDIPAGESIRWAPGEVRDVDLVAVRAAAPDPG
ncbi:MAG: urease subunit beta [Streptosporangiaceae bacterium]